MKNSFSMACLNTIEVLVRKQKRKKFKLASFKMDLHSMKVRIDTDMIKLKRLGLKSILKA